MASMSRITNTARKPSGQLVDGMLDELADLLERGTTLGIGVGGHLGKGDNVRVGSGSRVENRQLGAGPSAAQPPQRFVDGNACEPSGKTGFGVEILPACRRQRRRPAGRRPRLRHRRQGWSAPPDKGDGCCAA
jgi:hypothetical protein